MKKKKYLLIGIACAVVILAVLLGLVLTQCAGGQGEDTTPSTDAVGAAESYTLYWNLDRGIYGGKSEAGMSSRKPEADGIYYVRFFQDGEELTLKVTDRKLINAIDHEDVMGLDVDEDGFVTAVYTLDELPLERVGWRFSVQSAARTTIKLNSSENFDGMEILLEDLDPNRIWDMSGKTGPMGCVTEAIKYDKVMAVSDTDGNITHVFIFERPNYMLSHEAECEHCKQTVTWNEWTRTDVLPKDSGHYQLQNDITLKGQAALNEDAKVCLDLNGFRVEGKKNSRVIIMNKPSIELAIMDTSEGETGVIAAHGQNNMGVGVMVRYGAMYLYGGTIDASDAQNTSGTAISVSKGQFLYMYGGKIIGGEAQCKQNPDTGAYESGAGGAVYVSGKFVMHGGIIENGKATSITSYKNGSIVYNRGLGGNVYLASGSEFEMHGGTIRGGQADSYGGNIASDGTATILIDGGTISGGYVTGDGRMGGNIYASSKVSCTINGGTITGGRTRGHSGNIYCSGQLNINGGFISGGVAYDAKTGKLKTTATHHNIYVVNGTARIQGGTIQGGFAVTDSSATDAKTATLYLAGSPRITDGPNGYDLTISNKRVAVYVGTMGNGAKVGVYVKHGIFSKPTGKENADNFFSNIEGAEVLHYEDCLALGRLNCLCGKETHTPGCDGETLLWVPHVTDNDLPTTSGNYFLTKDVVTNKGYVVAAGEDVKLDFNGHNITYVVPSGTTAGFRLYRSDNASKMTLTDTTDAPGTMKTIMPAAGTKYTGKPLLKSEENGKKEYFEAGSAQEQAEAERLWAQGDYGTLLWARGGEINIINGIFDGSNITGSREQAGMVVYVSNSTVTNEATGKKTTYPATMNIYGGKIIGGDIKAPGNIAVKDGAVLNMYGGIVEGGKADKGGAFYVSGTVNIYGGTIQGGTSVTPDGVPADGGNIYVSQSGKLKVAGGTITGGKGDIGGNIYAYGEVEITGGIVEKGEASKCGGNLGTNSGKSTVTLGGNAIIRDGYGLRGGNLAIYVRGNKGFTVGGDVQILDGSAKESGGNIFVSTWLDEPSDVKMTGGLVSGGKAPVGGNVYVTGSSTASNANFTATDGVIEKGDSVNGANIGVGHASASITLEGVTVINTKENASSILADKGTLTVSEGTKIINTAEDGINVSTTNTANAVAKVVMTGGTIEGGKKGNVRILKNDSFEMSGGTITGGTATSGGNLYLYSSAGTMTGGTIAGGAAENGGNVYIEGTGAVSASFTMSGKAVVKDGISNTSANKGPNIRVNNSYSKLVLDGATVAGGIHANMGVVELKNAPVVDKTGTEYTFSLKLGSSARVDVSEMTGGRVYLSANVNTTVGINAASEKLTEYVLSEVTYNDLPVNVTWTESDQTLFMGNLDDLYCTCGASKNESYPCYCAAADQGESMWMAWPKTDVLPTTTGNYYLVGDVDLTAATVAKPAKNAVIRIDLRGNDILLENEENLYNFSGVSGVRLVITDTTATPGSVMLTGTDTETGGILKLSAGNTFALYHATMDVSGFLVGELDGGLAYISSGATFEMLSGRLVGNSAGRLLHVNGNANLLGGTVTGGKINIRLANENAQVRLKAVTVSNAVENATNIRVDLGKLTIEEGTVIDNTAEGAANVATTDSGNSVVLMTGGTIQGGKNSNVRILTGDSFTMIGGAVTGGTATNGGNIYLTNASATMIGGTVTGGTATKGGNIYLNSSYAAISGGTVEDGASKDGGGNIYMQGTTEAMARLHVGGEAVVTGGTDAANKGPNIRLNNSGCSMTLDGVKIDGGVQANAGKVELKNDVTIDKGDSDYSYSLKLGSNARIDVTTMIGGKVYVYSDSAPRIIAEDQVVDKTAYILSETKHNGLLVPVVWNEIERTLQLGAPESFYCTCGASAEDAYTCHCAEADKGQQYWTVWESADALPTTTGNYYLTGDVDLTAATVSAPAAKAIIRIDLRGHSILLEGEENLYNFTEESGARVVITDSTATPGSVAITGTATTAGGIMDLTKGNTFALYNAKLDASALKGNKGGHVANVASGGTFQMYSGELLGNTNTSVLGVKGNAALMGGKLSGGKINLYLSDAGAKVTLAGVKIPNAVENATSIRVDKGELTIAEGAEITNTAANATNITTNDTTTAAKIIMTGGTISDGTNSNVILKKNGSLTISGGTISGGMAGMGGNVYVVGDNASITATGGTIKGGESTSGANIAIDNASAKVTLGGVTVENTIATNHSILVKNGSLTIAEGAEIVNTADGAANVVTGDTAEDVAKITMTGGTVSGGKNSNIRIYAGDSFTMSGGTISGGTYSATTGRNGGNIYVNKGSVTVSAGDITGGEAKNGGNIYITSGTATISGGSITDGVATDAGGNIYLVSENSVAATATVSGAAVVAGGTAGTDNSKGYNIRLNNGGCTLVLDGATGIAGGIHVNSTSKATLVGAPVVKKADDGAYSLKMGANARLNVSGMTGGQVYITGDTGNTVAENVTADLTANIISEKSTVKVVWNETAKTLVLENKN